MTVSTLVIGLKEARFKAAETVQTGLRTLEFYAAAFSSTPDANGDIIDPHAFDTWLKAFYAEGRPLPLSFSHAAIQGPLDPTNTIGYAPADADHVWVDDYGLRVKGYIDVSSEKGKAVEWQIENNLIAGASIAYVVPAGALKKEKGHNRIMQALVREAGPTPNPANQEAVLLWLKSEGMLSQETAEPYMTVAEFREVFLKWDGAAAMATCTKASDFAAIAFERANDSADDTAAHWALPHHPRPDAEADPQGVAAALAAMSGARGGAPDLKNADAARAHLEAHQGEKAAEEVVETKHQASPAYIQAAHDALVRGGAKCAEVAPEMKVAAPESDPDRERLRRLRFIKTSLV